MWEIKKSKFIWSIYDTDNIWKVGRNVSTKNEPREKKV